MKKSVKAALILAIPMLLSLWAGYVVGYRRGVRDDQREWWASVQLDSHGNRIFLGPQAKAAFNDYSGRQNPIPDKSGK